MNDQPKPRGFQTMTAERQREIASAGGQAAHRKGSAHQFTTEEARAAGRKGGAARQRNAAARKAQLQLPAVDQAEGLGAPATEVQP